MVLIRAWLCSASRVRQPNRPVSGIPASPAVSRRILASFRPSGGRVPPQSNAGLSERRIQLKLGHLHKRSRIIGLPTIRVTHLAKKALQMRHKIATRGLNPLKKRSLKGHD